MFRYYFTLRRVPGLVLILALALACAALVFSTLTGFYGPARDIPTSADTRAVRKHAENVAISKYFFVRSGNQFSAVRIENQTDSIDATQAEVDYTVTNWDNAKRKWQKPQQETSFVVDRRVLLHVGSVVLAWTPLIRSGSLAPVAAPGDGRIQVALCDLDNITDRDPTTARWHYGYL